MTNSETGPSKSHPNLLKIEDKNRKLKHEEANAFDDKGNVIFSKGGNSNSVEFTPMDCYRLSHSTFTHNHPRGSIFSKEDIVFTVHNQLEEMRATQPDGGVFSLKRTGIPRNTFPRDYEEQYYIAVGKARFKMDEYVPKLMNQGKITSEDANNMFSQKINDEFIPWLKANAGNYGYEFTHYASGGTLNKSFKDLIHKADKEPKSDDMFLDKDMFYLDRDTNVEIEKIVNEWYEKSKTL